MNQMKNEQFEEKTREVEGDLTIKKSRVFDNIAKAVTLILAITIWLYVVATNVVEKPIPLIVKEKNGMSADYIALESQSLVVRGASALIDQLQQLQLEDFSAKNLIDDDGDGFVEIELGIKEGTLPDGINEVLKANGASFSVNKVKVKAVVEVGASHELKVPKDYIKVINSEGKIVNSEYEVTDDFVTLTVRSFVPEEDGSLFNKLTAYLDPDNNTEALSSVITIFANIDENTPARAEVPISVSFEGEFKGVVYEVLNSDGSPYTVSIQSVAKGAEQ